MDLAASDRWGALRTASRPACRPTRFKRTAQGREGGHMNRKPRKGQGRRRSRKARTHRSRVRRAVTTAPQVSDPFRHVVVLMLENRSFDHMVGALQATIPGLNGVPPAGPPRVNKDS